MHSSIGRNKLQTGLTYEVHDDGYDDGDDEDNDVDLHICYNNVGDRRNK
jgi:hypothetical protein